MMGRDKFNESVTSTPNSRWDWDNNYDSKLKLNVYANENCTLRINLRIFYRSVNPNEATSDILTLIARAQGLVAPGGSKVGMHPDYNKNYKWIRDWTPVEWANFISAVKTQAGLWDNKFWLIPPDDFTHFDRTEGSWTAPSGGITYRPNIKCEFNFDVAAVPSNAHTSVDVVNILGSNFFRSDNMNYSSNDATPRATEKPDWRSNVVRNNHPVIAHEIGHSLGLPHIGQTRNLLHCGLAINWAKFHTQDTLPWIYKGGSGADVCYGTQGSAGDINNIMGAGASFTAENAAPWLNRLFYHVNMAQHERVIAATNLHKWRVVTAPAPPRKIA